LYVQEGREALGRLERGRDGIVAMLGAGAFFGEGCLAGQPTCSGTATAMMNSNILFIGKDAMVRTRSDKRVEDQPMRVEVLEADEIEEKQLMTPGASS
jgi:CRP-like cAMP-binding protein